VEVADAPLEVALPEAVPLPLACAEEEGVVVGAGVATLKECQIVRQEHVELKVHTSGSFNLKIGALSKYLGTIGRVYERDLVASSRTKRHISHSECLQQSIKTIEDDNRVDHTS
jgi:hypothetical protein